MIHNDFLLEEILKEGPRGRIMLLRHKQTRRRVVARHFTGSSEAYRQMMSLSCPYLPRVEACAEENGLVLVLEEYIPGDSLAILLRGGPLRPEQARSIAADVARALQALHRLSIVHRDVKPENILLDGNRAVLIDFDASRLCKEEAEADTRIMGTTGYAAPEQYGFSQTDARADIYSLGILLNEMLTRRHPATRLAEGPLRPIIEKCIEVNVDKRYGSAAEVLAALQHPPARRPDRRRELSALISSLVILLAALIFLAGVLLRPDRSPEAFSRTAAAPASAAPAASSAPEPAAFDPSAADLSAPIADVRLIPESDNHSYTGFTCDLDGNGQPEDYVFCIYMDFAGPNGTILSPTGSDASRVPEGTSRGKSFAPVVLRRLAGGYEFAEEFAPLLEQAQLNVLPVYTLDSGSPSLKDIDPLYGLWSGARYITYTSDCTGLWRYEASAVLHGQTLTASSTSAINLISMPSSDPPLATEIPGAFLGVTDPEAPVTSLSTVTDGDDVHHTRFTCNLDGNGREETYTFRICFNVHGNYPTPVSRDGRLLTSESPVTHIFVPAVFMETDNGLESADHFQELLEDIRLEVVCIRNPDGGEPAVSDAGPLAGWENGRQVSYSPSCRGQWKYEASAVFNGQTLTAAAVTTIQVDGSL